MIFFDTWKEAKKLAKQKRLDKIDANEKKTIAKLFNDRYTYRLKYFNDGKTLPGTSMYGMNPSDAYAWMCPFCNKIHRPVESSVFSGLQYPRCCPGTSAGNRLSDNIRIA